MCSAFLLVAKLMASADKVWCLYEDQEGEIWAEMPNELNHFQKRT